MLVLKLALYFSLSFVILSVRIGGVSVFEHVDKHTHPITGQIIESTKNKANLLLSSSVQIAKKIFQNTTPEKTDNVKQSLSATQKKNSHLKKELEEDHYTEEEKEILKNIIDQAQY